MLNKQILPGLLLTIAIAAFGFLAKSFLGFAGAEVYALLFGIVLGNTMTKRDSWQVGIQFSEKKILGWAIALMGLELNFGLLNISWYIAPLILLVIAVTMFLGRHLPSRVKVNSTCGYMIGVGHAICGASAIAAVSPFISKESHETGVAVGVVNILGTLGMIILPLVAIGLGMSDENAGILIGASLQAVGNAVGGGYAVSEEAGQIATLVKLGRVLMLGPVVLFTALLFHTKTEGGVQRKKVLPGFIIVFLILLLITNIFTVSEQALDLTHTLDKMLLAIAMAGIGLQIKFADLKSKGPQALVLGSVIFATQIAIVFTFIYGQEFFR